MRKTFICEDDMLTEGGKLKVWDVISDSFEDDCSYLTVNKSFLESFGVTNTKSRLEANIDVKFNYGLQADMTLWAFRTGV